MRRDAMRNWLARKVLRRTPKLLGRVDLDDRLIWVMAHTSRRLIRVAGLRALTPELRANITRSHRTITSYTRTSPRWRRIAGTHYKIAGLHAAIRRSRA